MSTDAAALKSLVEAELSQVHDRRVADFVRSLLVEPYVVKRVWDYGEPGQTLPCWTVLEDEGLDTAIAYSALGFGPRCPWGLVSGGKEPRGSMGMDSGWFPTFMQAFFDSVVATRLPIWRVFTMNGGYPAEPLTEELSWEDAWARCEEVRESDRARYVVHHTVEYGGSRPPSTKTA